MVFGMLKRDAKIYKEMVLNLALNDIDYIKTKAASPQTNGICERFH